MRQGRMSWLEHPVVYGWVQGLLVPRSCRRTIVDRYVAAKPGERFLDLGCGTGLILDYLPPLDYWGIDSNPRYVEYAQKRYAGRGRFVCADLGEAVWPVEGKFKHAMAIGLLHHLPDDKAKEVLSRARDLLAPGGKLVTMDGCFEKGQPLPVRKILEMDRGKYVRTREGYLELVRTVFKDPRSSMERNLLRVPYSHLILELTAD